MSDIANPPEAERRRRVHRVQTGVRLEKRLVKVTKALAEYLGMSMGDLLEGVLLHAFDGRAPFSEETLGKISGLKEIYGLDLDASDSHHLIDAGDGEEAVDAADEVPGGTS
jgi:hypothetical protein